MDGTVLFAEISQEGSEIYNKMYQTSSNMMVHAFRLIDKNMKAHPTRFVNRGIRLFFRILAGALCSVKRVDFPTRKTGEDWNISLYQIEFCMGWLEPESLIHVRNLVRPGMSVLDIGAHIGYYTDILSRLVKAEGRVHAIEASPENFPILKRNLAAKNRHNVTVHHAAVSDRSGMIKLYVSPGHSNHSVVAGYTDSHETVDVQSVRLDEFFPNQVFDFIKMDVEGHEPHVLDGMRELIKRSPSLTMLIEYNPIALSKVHPSPKILLDLLTELGIEYQAVLIDGSLGNIPNGMETVNLLCWKK